MRLVEIIKILKETKVKILSLSDLKKLLDIENDNTAYKIAEKLIGEKFLLRIKKGTYISTFNSPEDFELANALYVPSYISFESALSYYGILSQFPYSTTSVSPKKTKKITVEGKEYSYTQISRKLYWGFRREGQIIIASQEKALLDMLYITAKGRRKVELDELDYSSINKKDFYKMCQKVKYRPFLNKLKEIRL